MKKLFTFNLKSLLLMCLMTLGLTASAEDVSVATFKSADAVTNSGYASNYGGDDWSINMAGNNKSIGFNNKNCVAIGDALGTSATETNYGIVVKSKKAFENVNKISFTFSGGSGQGGKIYLAYSADGTNWDAISLMSGTGLSAQGTTVATTLEQPLVFSFEKKTSAYYAIILDSGDKKTAAYRFDSVVIDFINATSSGSDKPTVKTLSSIAVTTQPTKTEYTVGDALDLTGCVVTATYSDNTTSNVTSSCTFSPANGAKLETAGTQKVAVSYESKTTSFNVTVNAATTPGGGDDTPLTSPLTIDFEQATTDYPHWTFTNITTKGTNSNVPAHSGDYFGTTGGKETGSIQTNDIIPAPTSITFYISKQTTNTTSSSWKIQVSSDGASWTDVKTASASSVTRGEWTKVSQSLSEYKNVYVRVYYTGSTAVRCIDDLSLTFSTGGTSTDKTTPTLSFSQAEVTATLGEDFVAPTLTNESNVEVVYSSSDPKVATVNATTGAVTLVGVGTTTITAEFMGNDTYNAAEASYTLTVKIATEGEGTKENPYTIQDVIKLNNSTSGKVWVVGYILGNCKSATELETDETKIIDSNIALGETAGASSFLPVQLPSGSVRTALNVKDNPTNVGRMVKVYGSLESYFSTTGIKSVTDYEFLAEPSAFTLTLQAEGPLMQTADISGVVPEHMYYATFSSDKDVVLESENVVYVGGVGLDEEGNITFIALDAILDGYVPVGYYIPANKGVMIISTATEAAYTYASAMDNLEEYYIPECYLDEDGNLLHPASEAKTGDFKFYKLAYEDATMKPETLGFYWGAENGAAFTSRVGSAYLAVPEEAAAKGFRLVVDDVTAVKNVENKVKTNAVYNLAGQRVADKNFKGIVIKNGKKMLNK